MVRKIAAGTANLAKGPAMSRQDAEKSIVSGFQLATDLFQQGIEVLGTGDMGIANTTASAAIGSVITGIGPKYMVGRGTGIDDKGFVIKLKTVEKGIRINQPNALDGLDVLAKVGGLKSGASPGAYWPPPFTAGPWSSTVLFPQPAHLLPTPFVPWFATLSLAGIALRRRAIEIC